MKKLLLATLIFLPFATPVFAEPSSSVSGYEGGNSTFKSVDSSVDNDSFNAVNDSENTQRNQGTVNQTAIYNIGEAAKYRFGEFGVTCASPVGMLSGGRVRYDNEYTDQVSFALVFPFGGRNGSNCKRAAEAITNEHILDTEMKTAKACAELGSNGVVLSEEQFPFLAEMCQGVDITPIVRAPVPEVQIQQAPPPPPVIQEAPPIIRRTRG